MQYLNVVDSSPVATIFFFFLEERSGVMCSECFCEEVAFEALIHKCKSVCQGKRFQSGIC